MVSVKKYESKRVVLAEMKSRQATAHLDAETKEWLSEYAASLKLKVSEVLRFLLMRERQVQWLKWVMDQPDPSQHEPRPGLRAPAKASEWEGQLKARRQKRKATKRQD